MRRKDEVRSAAPIIAVLGVAMMWFFAAMAGSALIALYVPLGIKK